VRADESLDFRCGPAAERRTAGVRPPAERHAIDHRRRPGDLVLQMTACVVGDQQVPVVHQLLEERNDCAVVFLRARIARAQRHRADLVVEHELLETEAVLHVEHAGTRHVVDPGERGERRAHGGLGAGLRVEQLGVAERDVPLRRQPQRPTDLRARARPNHRLDCAHGCRLVADVEDR
jgi:hypothetical protein